MTQRTFTAGRLDTGFIIRNLDPDEDSIRLRIEGFAPTSYDITMNGADADVTYGSMERRAGSRPKALPSPMTISRSRASI